MTDLNDQSTSTNFTVVPDAFCDRCYDMRQVFQCTFCAATFCDSCTDLEAWLSDHIKACPSCGYISPDQPGDAASVMKPDFSSSSRVKLLVNANADTLEAARRQYGFTAQLCDYTEEFGMDDLDAVAAEALEQFAIHLGIPYQGTKDITRAPINLRAILSDAALQSPTWEDHRKVSKHLLHHLNQQLGDELTQLINEA